MTTATRNALISSRVSLDTKARLSALAATRGMSESALIGQLIEAVVCDKAAPPDVEHQTATSDRITLRLRSGDRALADVRAAERSMKTSSYLAMLMRAHLRSGPVMPVHELNALKSTVGHMTALGRQIGTLVRSQTIGSPGASTRAEELSELLRDVGQLVENVRRDVSDVVYVNLRSWSVEDAAGNQEDRDA